MGVLMGGRSAEREVSLRTGAAIAAALRRLGRRAVEIDAGPDLPRQLARRKVDVAFIALHGRGHSRPDDADHRPGGAGIRSSF